MSGTTISSNISQPVTLGSVSYTSPLTITSSGTIAPSQTGATALYGTLAGGTIVNQGTLIGAAGTPTGGDGILLTAGYANNQGVILGGFGTTLSGYGAALSGGATLVNNAFINGASSNTTFAGAALLQGDALLINNGTIAPAFLPSGAGGNGVVFDNAILAAFTNNVSGIVTGLNAVYANDTTMTLANAGTISGNFAGLLISGPTLRVTNTGLIEATGSNALDGIGVEGSATIVNGSPTDTTAQIYGAKLGISILTLAATSSISSVVNYGTVRGGVNPGIHLVNGTVVNGSATDTTAYIDSIYLKAGFGNTGGLIENFGTDSAIGTFNGVYLGNGTLINGSATDTAALIDSPSGLININTQRNTTITNYGTISGGSASGIYMQSGVITNAAGATITAGNIGAHIGGYGGVTLVNAGLIEAKTGVSAVLQYRYNIEVVNTGTIASSLGNTGTAVVMGKGTNVLVDHPGAVFIGTVVGGTGKDTLDLASAASTGTVTGIGTQFKQFSTIALDSGAQWTVQGTYTGFNGVTIAGFAMGDTIVLQGITATGATLGAGNVLTVLETNGGTVALDLAVGQGFSGDIFSTDTSAFNGSAASEITLQAAVAPSIAGTAAGQAVTDETTIQPFSGATVTDGNPGATDTVTIVLSDAANGTLSGSGLTLVSTGTYTLTGSAAAVTTALDALTFTPTAHEVAPGNTVTTSMTLTVSDGIASPATDSTTSVIATAVNDAPTITALAERIGTPNETTKTPFATIAIADPDIGHTDTVTVTLSDAAGGTLSNLGGGSFDAATGVYTDVGSASAVTTDLDGLVFTPSRPASGLVSTTGFSIQVTGPGGTVGDNGISVTSVQQVASLAGNPAGNDAISVSPDGSGFAAPTQGEVNEAVVGNPVSGDSYSLPTGYQAIFLGGSVAAALTDASVGNALLVGNIGNDTISAAAGGDTIFGGSVANTLIASGASDVVSARGNDTVTTSGSADTVFVGSGTVALHDSGSNDALGLGTGTDTVTLSGSAARVYASTGTADIVDTGSADVIGAFTGTIAATLSGSAAIVYGRSSPLSVDMTGAASGAAIGTGSGNALVTVGGSGATVYGGSGSLTADVTGADAVIGLGGTVSALTIGGAGTTVFGNQGSLTADIAVGSTNARIGLGGGSSALTLSGSGSEVFGGSGSFSAVDTGGNDTISAGTGATSVTGGSGGLVVSGSSGSLEATEGTGPTTIYGGTGNATITGGGGATTLYGGAGGTIDFIGNSTLIYQAGLGNETLNGSGATSGVILGGGIDRTGGDLLIGGSGNDSIFAGTGADTMAGGAGTNEFVWYQSVVNGSTPSDVITDFNANDSVILAGYGSGAAAAALTGATSANGSTTLTLSDNTQITFIGIDSASGLTGHVFST
jgi:Ca2+-binding RTX toxin-like protein